jgi:uncharacterized protein with HEPN domain
MKSKNRSYQAYLEDMIASIEKILRYISTVKDADDFIANELVIDAVTRNYEIIGEASNKIPKAVKERYPELPWRQMYGLRNFAVHDYHVIDYKILWHIAKDHLPKNKVQLEQILEKEKDNGGQPE